MSDSLTIDQIEEIEMDLTGSCNLHCPLCTRNYEHARHMLVKNIRPMSDIISQLDKFTGLKRFFIAGAISEPTLHPEFTRFIEYLNGRDIYFELFTNGNTHNKEWWNHMGELVPEKCMTCFTICGSTQELHEKYRKGSNLQQILDNSDAYRQNNKHNDWLQHILFEYNKEDYQSGHMKSIYDRFSHVMTIGSEGIRRLDEKINTYDNDIKPVDDRDRKIKYIFNRRTPLKDINTEINCKSFNERKVYIDQFGKVSACYIHYEFEKDYFDMDNGVFDYSHIHNYEFPDCYACSKDACDMIERFKLDFIC